MTWQNDEKVKRTIWVDKLSDGDAQRIADGVLSAMVEVFNAMGGYEDQTGDEHCDGEKYRWC